MPAPVPPSARDRQAPTRALAALAVSLAVVNAAFVWWPSLDLGPELPTTAPAREMVVMEMIEPTTQPPPPATLPPAPPPPPEQSDVPPVEVPDEVLVEDVVRDIEIAAPPERPAPRQPVRRAAPPAPPAPPPPAPSGPSASSDRIVERPDRSPRVSGQAFPVYPPGSDFRGSARVKVLVSPGGRVTDAEIVERTAFRRGREEPTDAFPSAIEAAVLDAARRYLFRPARDGGERVRAYAFVTVSLDPPS